MAHFIPFNLRFLRSNDFEANKAGKLAIQPWLSCLYNKNTLMGLASSVPNTVYSSLIQLAKIITNLADIDLGHHKFFFTAHISNLGMWQHNNDDFWQVMPIFLVRVPIFVFLTWKCGKNHSLASITTTIIFMALLYSIYIRTVNS